MVECQLPKLDVAGSIPVSRSKFLHRKVSTYNYCLLRLLLIRFSSMIATMPAPLPLPAQDELHRNTGHWQVPSTPEKLSGQVGVFA